MLNALSYATPSRTLWLSLDECDVYQLMQIKCFFYIGVPYICKLKLYVISFAQEKHYILQTSQTT